MAFEVETPSETQAKVRIRVAPEAVAEALEHEIADLKQRARLPGFRPGKVPRQVLEKKVGDSLVRSVRRRLVTEALEEGIQERHLHPVDAPPLEDRHLEPKEDGSLSVELDFEVIPHVDPTGYDRFSARPPAIVLHDEDVDRELEGLRRQAARFEEVADGLIAAGDVVVVDLRMRFLDGSSLPPFENRVVDTGAGLVDGVPCEDAKSVFVGRGRGDALRLTIKLPVQFPIEEHRGKTAVTDCTVKDVRRIVLPELQSAEFHSLFGAKDFEDLRGKVRERLQRLLKAEQDRALEELCVDELLERNRCVLPAGFLQRRLDSERERIRRELVERGLPPEQIERQLLEIEGRLRTEVERRLCATFLLDRLADKLGVEVGSQELEQQFVLMAQTWQVDPQKLFDEMHAQGLVPRVIDDLRRAKVRRQLRETAAAAEEQAEDLAGTKPSENAK
jgi:trigger factor